MTSLTTLKRANTASRKCTGIMQPIWGTRRVILAFFAALSFSRFDGEANIELIKFRNPPDENGIQKPFANTPGIRHIAFVVEDIEAVLAKLRKNGAEIFNGVQQYEDSYKLCYLCGPEGLF